MPEKPKPQTQPQPQGSGMKPTGKKQSGSAGAGADAAAAWLPLVKGFEAVVRASLPSDEPRAAELAPQFSALVAALASESPGPARLAEFEALGERARRLFAHRQELVGQLGALCRELTQGLTELAEDDGWARGQCEAVQARLAEGLSARGVRAASVLLAETRERQRRVRLDRQAARDGLKQLIHTMVQEVSQLGEQTGRNLECSHCSAMRASNESDLRE